MKKVILGTMILFSMIFGSVFAGLGSIDFEEAYSNPYDDAVGGTTDTTDIGEILNNNENSGGSLLSGIMSAYRVNPNTETPAIEYISVIINYALSLVSFIALIVLLRGFFMMFFSKDNGKTMEDGRKLVMGAVVALVLIGLSWIIVSWIFGFASSVTN